MMTDSEGKWTMDACCVGEEMDMGSYGGYAFPPDGANYAPGPLAFIVDGADKTGVRIFMLEVPAGTPSSSVVNTCAGGGGSGGSTVASPPPPPPLPPIPPGYGSVAQISLVFQLAGSATPLNMTLIKLNFAKALVLPSTCISVASWSARRRLATYLRITITTTKGVADSIVSDNAALFTDSAKLSTALGVSVTTSGTSPYQMQQIAVPDNSALAQAASASTAYQGGGSPVVGIITGLFGSVAGLFGLLCYVQNKKKNSGQAKQLLEMQKAGAGVTQVKVAQTGGGEVTNVTADNDVKEV